jgi:hypothetical protein
VKYVVNGKTVSREEFSQKPTKQGWLAPRVAHVQVTRSNKPLVSESVGVLPGQVAETRKKLRKLQEHGLLTGVSIADKGQAEFTSTGEQGRVGWMRYRKKVDFDGGYSATYTDDGRYGD